MTPEEFRVQLDKAHLAYVNVISMAAENGVINPSQEFMVNNLLSITKMMARMHPDQFAT